MASTTTSTTPLNDTAHTRSASHSRSRSGTIPSRPTTPLRPPSRTSLRASQSSTTPTAGQSLLGSSSHASSSASSSEFPLNLLEPAFSELSDSMADLEANMMHLQLLQSSISRFNESFGAFLYGMNMTAFCVDFPEAPITQSYPRHKDRADQLHDSPFAHDQYRQKRMGDDMAEATFMTSDTSGFVENPPPTTGRSSKFTSVPGSTTKPSAFNSGARASAASRGGAPGGSTAGRATASSRARGSGIARGTSSRGSASGSSRGSSIARGVGRGRGVR